ncbi:DUF2493 domain-containing protein [Streptomyces sp. DW4-2]|uniref:DUF2493 domain-containing protein n=1 Tax=Streptomyces spirodelae TaxID=2812904 RepID=A0ABS3X3G5_9ACTN|nr:DUF2493 domain-containing protein [Streptomyces spirodelae]
MIPPQRILVTGTSDVDPRLVRDALTDAWHDLTMIYGPAVRMVVMHGDEAAGAVAVARDWAAEHGVSEEPHAGGGIYRHGAPVARVPAMLEHADMCLAFIGPDDRPAQATARLARRAGIPVRYCGTA